MPPGMVFDYSGWDESKWDHPLGRMFSLPFDDSKNNDVQHRGHTA
jgi:hypothetical protein